MKSFTFWQRALSPHSVPLAVALRDRGHLVTMIVLGDLAEKRRSLGWSIPKLGDLNVITLGEGASREEINSHVKDDAIHLLQGLPRSGTLKRVQSCLVERAVQFGSVMEQVNDSGLLGLVKSLEYSFRLRNRNAPQFVLAIGERAPTWFRARASKEISVYPFAYFLDRSEGLVRASSLGKFSIGFVGHIEGRKRLDLLLDALSKLTDQAAYRLICVGDGPEGAALKRLGAVLLNGASVEWRGVLPRDEVLVQMSSFDLLVLPSRFDGWGAVVSEALIRGVPVICSDACGASSAVRRAPFGYVFESGDVENLVRGLSKAMDAGALSPSERESLSSWAQCLTAPAGAVYLEEIVRSLGNEAAPRPAPPWENTENRD
jgi:hypothetical protein